MVSLIGDFIGELDFSGNYQCMQSTRLQNFTYKLTIAKKKTYNKVEGCLDSQALDK